MLRKKINGVANGPRLSSTLTQTEKSVVDRRTFLRGSGLAATGLVAATALSAGRVQKAQAAGENKGNIEIKNRFARIVLLDVR